MITTFLFRSKEEALALQNREKRKEILEQVFNTLLKSIWLTMVRGQQKVPENLFEFQL